MFIATSSFKVLRRSLGSGQYVSIKYTERLVQAGVEPSVGSVGDSYDNALAETINGLYKAEIIHRRGPWRSLQAVEFATWNGWTGSTTGGSWSPSATSRRPKPRNATTPCWNNRPWRHALKPNGLRRTRGGS
jgi:transposase InsO family protein